MPSGSNEVDVAMAGSAMAEPCGNGGNRAAFGARAGIQARSGGSDTLVPGTRLGLGCRRRPERRLHPPRVTEWRGT